MNNYRGYCSPRSLPRISRPRMFISYSENDKSQVALLRYHKRCGKLDFVDYSIKNRYRFNWEASAWYRIRETDGMIVAMNNYRLSRGMIIEIEMAKKLNKPIIVVKYDRGIPLPSVLKCPQTIVVPYDCRMIQHFIDECHLKSQRPRY